MLTSETFVQRVWLRSRVIIWERGIIISRERAGRRCRTPSSISRVSSSSINRSAGITDRRPATHRGFRFTVEKPGCGSRKKSLLLFAVSLLCGVVAHGVVWVLMLVNTKLVMRILNNDGMFLPDGATLIRPTKGMNVGRIRRKRRHPAATILQSSRQCTDLLIAHSKHNLRFETPSLPLRHRRY